MKISANIAGEMFWIYKYEHSLFSASLHLAAIAARNHTAVYSRCKSYSKSKQTIVGLADVYCDALLS